MPHVHVHTHVYTNGVVRGAQMYVDTHAPWHMPAHMSVMHVCTQVSRARSDYDALRVRERDAATELEAARTQMQRARSVAADIEAREHAAQAENRSLKVRCEAMEGELELARTRQIRVERRLVIAQEDAAAASVTDAATVEMPPHGVSAETVTLLRERNAMQAEAMEEQRQQIVVLRGRVDAAALEADNLRSESEHLFRARLDGAQLEADAARAESERMRRELVARTHELESLKSSAKIALATAEQESDSDAERLIECVHLLAAAGPPQLGTRLPHSPSVSDSLRRIELKLRSDSGSGDDSRGSVLEAVLTAAVGHFVVRSSLLSHVLVDVKSFAADVGPHAAHAQPPLSEVVHSVHMFNSAVGQLETEMQLHQVPFERSIRTLNSNIPL